MARLEDVLIPSRFLLTSGHFITAILAFYNLPINVAAGFPMGGSAADLAAARGSLLTALSIAMLCFIVQFLGLFGGFTMFRNPLNLFHSVLHFFGGVLGAWYLIGAWGFLSYWCVPRGASRCIWFCVRPHPPAHISPRAGPS